MAEWRNGGMAEWRNGRKNGRMSEWREWLHTYSCSLSENKSFAFLTWATRRTKKTQRQIFLCSSSVLDFSLSCVKRLLTVKSNIRQKWLHTYYLRYTHTEDIDDDDDDDDDDYDNTLIFYSIDKRWQKASETKNVYFIFFLSRWEIITNWSFRSVSIWFVVIVPSQ